MEKRDVIQLKLKYSDNLYIYCNMNNIDFYFNAQSLMMILSFFDLQKPSIKPKIEYSLFNIPSLIYRNKSTNTMEVPKLFTIMTYLYTVHPSISVSNFHIYIPEDATNPDSSIIIISLPEIIFRDNSVKTELTEKEKDLLVLNNYSSNRLSLVNNPKIEEDVQSIDRVLVSCEINNFNVICCDINDLYDDNHYVTNHKLKVVQNMNMNVFLFLYHFIHLLNLFILTHR